MYGSMVKTAPHGSRARGEHSGMDAGRTTPVMLIEIGAGGKDLITSSSE